MSFPPLPLCLPRTCLFSGSCVSHRCGFLCLAVLADVEEFYAFCDPEKENLCLYGLLNGSWEVALPSEEVPPEMLEPALGINFTRDVMKRRDWLPLVAVHSDTWLISVAYFYASDLNDNDRYLLH
ncbi:PHD finger protein ALFIN-LIKE 1 [Dichanthelium oligosanthes]|uniref:PHD finger protein ALFIN-LIKE n=1 Tax=Dichanthelium oligosanthes TaxID=888268 RepID=A0A1E5W4M3_9POAL|nr:PHD finger protein ALFIN-LIKE 1 [Dichanthelium oligosanthes]